MGYVYADLTLRKAADVLDNRRGIRQDIRQTTVNAMVDTGAFTLIINEAVQKELGLMLMEDQEIFLADRTAKMCKYTEPVEIQWKNRSAILQALVIENTEEILLGALPLEAMDLIVDPARETLIGRHGDRVIHRV